MATTTTPARQVRAGCYCRISSDPNDKRQGIDRQRDDTTTLCEVKGWTPAGFYIDNDRSASNGKARPEWDRLLADVKAGEIDAIVVWNQDRGWRQMSQLEELRRFFESLGRRVLLTTTLIGDIDLYDPYGVYAAQNRTAASELETAVMKVRIRRAAEQKAERGAPNWSRAFGYLGNTYQLDPETAPLVKEAYADILAGVSLSEICRRWNARGITTVNGKPWTASLLTKFLRKPRNAGLRTYKDNLYGPTNKEAVVAKGDWPPLVDEARFWDAQAVLDTPSRKPGRKTVRRHLLTGVARCGKEGCGNTLSASYRKDQIIYVCKACHGVSILADNLEPDVLIYIQNTLADEDAVDLLKDELQDAEEAERLRDLAKKFRVRLGELADENADGLYDVQEYVRMRDRVKEQLAAVEAQQRSQERLRIFDGLPLGTPECAAAVAQLPSGRLRAILDVLATVTVKPVGKIGRGPIPDRVDIEPKR